MNAELITKVQSANGKRKTRIIKTSDIEYFENLFNERKDDPAVKTIRVYPDDAFVPNSYKYRAEVTIIQATRNNETGEWLVGAGVVDAKRSHARGAKVTINGRAV